MRHPRFYLPTTIAKDLNLTSFHKGERSMEASRRRGGEGWSVICDPQTAQELIPRIEAMQAKAEPEADYYRALCDTALAAVRHALEEATKPLRLSEPDPPGLLGSGRTPSDDRQD